MCGAVVTPCKVARGTTWRVVLAVTPFVAVGVLLMPGWARSLNLLVHGEREARHLGVTAEVEMALDDALAIVDPYFTAGLPAAALYSAVGNAERGRIVQVSYHLQDRLLAARAALASG